MASPWRGGTMDWSCSAGRCGTDSPMAMVAAMRTSCSVSRSRLPKCVTMNCDVWSGWSFWHRIENFCASFRRTRHDLSSVAACRSWNTCWRISSGVKIPTRATAPSTQERRMLSWELSVAREWYVCMSDVSLPAAPLAPLKMVSLGIARKSFSNCTAASRRTIGASSLHITWMPDLYGILPEAEQKEVIGMYQVMCNDEAPMVRRLAAVQFEKLFLAMSKETIMTAGGASGNETSLMQTYHSLATDSSQDSIRRSCVDGAVALVGILSPEEIRQHVLQLLQSATEDKSG